MRKYVFMFLVCALAANVASAQNFSEWFRQKKTQKRYLLEQIAALKAYSEVVQKGYGVARDGLSAVRKITDGEFTLHDLFFTSLRNVSPWVKRYGRIADIIELHAATARFTTGQLKRIKRSGTFSGAEIRYLELVFDRLLADCTDVLDELIFTVSDGRLELSDDQRLSRIDMLYEKARDQWSFAQEFGQEAQLMQLFRSAEARDAALMEKIYGPFVE